MCGQPASTVRALGVVDIPEERTPKLPAFWPGLPIFNGDTDEVKVAFENTDVIDQASYDSVAAGLRVNKSVHAPLLCVVNVMDVASEDLS